MNLAGSRSFLVLLSISVVLNLALFSALATTHRASWWQKELFPIEQSPVKSQAESPKDSQFASPFTLDFLSIGSHSRIEYLETQQFIYSSSQGVRRFFNVTEVDDFDPSCPTTLTEADTRDIKGFCTETRRMEDPIESEGNDYVFQNFSRYFFPPAMVKNYKDKAAWLCAQQRPLAGMQKVVRSYQQTSEEVEEAFPDYLVILDDDTYIDVSSLRSLIQRYEIQHQVSSKDRVALSGCKFRRPLSFAHGGFGLILSRGALLALNDPMRVSSDATVQAVLRPWKNSSGVPFEGSSLLDAVTMIAKQNSFVAHRQWTFPGFCMHSDWVWGYMTQLSGITEIDRLQPKQFCTRKGEDCLKSPDGASICHNASPDIMQKLYEKHNDPANLTKQP